MKIAPASGLVLIKPDPIAEKSKGGIILVEESKEWTTRGEVLDLGPESKLEIQVGDFVRYEKDQGTAVTVEGKDLLIIDEKFIMLKEVDE